MKLKTCKSCGEAKPATTEYFNVNKGGLYGLRGQCKPCWNRRVRYLIKQPEAAAARKAYHKRSVESGKAAEWSRKWDRANPEKAKAAKAKSNRKRKDAIREYNRRWRQENPEKIAAIRKRTAEKMKANPGYVLHRRVKSRVRQLLKGVSFGVTEDILGYSREDLVAHIEAQFTEGMTWEALATGAIHIDHIRPVSSFDFSTKDCEDFKRCWALENLRPMWAIENQRKGSRWVGDEG